MTKPTIALFLNHPECSQDCVDGMTQSLSTNYNIKTFGVNECNSKTFKNVDIVAFPGGIGDATSYDRFFRRRAQNAVADFVANGGRYLGICMGAYWAGSYFFDILDSVDAVQYITQPGTDTRRPHAKDLHILWRNRPERMFFYDGCALIGNTNKFDTIARYGNGDAMAIKQNHIGLIGCHPEAEQFWYDGYTWMRGKYASKHHLLLDFVNQLHTTT